MLAFALWKSQNYNESYKLVEGIIAMGNTDEVIYKFILGNMVGNSWIKIIIGERGYVLNCRGGMDGCRMMMMMILILINY